VGSPRRCIANPDESGWSKCLTRSDDRLVNAAGIKLTSAHYLAGWHRCRDDGLSRARGVLHRLSLRELKWEDKCKTGGARFPQLLEFCGQPCDEKEKKTELRKKVGTYKKSGSSPRPRIRSVSGTLLGRRLRPRVCFIPFCYVAEM